METTQRTRFLLARRRLFLSVSFGTVLLGVGLPIGYLRTQNSDRNLKTKGDFDPPVKIRRIESRIGVIESNKTFSADEDWFKGLRVKLQNTGTEPVTFIELRLRFPRTSQQRQKGEFDILFHLYYGVNPFVFSNESAQPLEQGDEVILELSEDAYHVIRENPRFPATLKQIEISVSKLKFIDGTLWIAGKRYRQSTNDPQKLIPLQTPEHRPRSSVRYDRLLEQQLCKFNRLLIKK